MFNWFQKKDSAEYEPTLLADEEPGPPTLTFAIPFPEPPIGCTKEFPPFLLYAPPAARLKAPAEGESESMQDKAVRHWQETHSNSREAIQRGDAGFRDKAVSLVSKAMSATKNSRVEFLVRTPNASKLKELKMIYPSWMTPEDVQEKFQQVLQQTKNAAIRNGVIATALLPFVFVIDTLTFLPGPFEINAVFAVASWTGASRAASISNGVEKNKVDVLFEPDDRLNHFGYRVHQLAFENRKVGVPIEVPHWKQEDPALQGVELASLVLAMINAHVGLGACELYERDLERLSEDLEEVLLKGAKEWLACVT